MNGRDKLTAYDVAEHYDRAYYDDLANRYRRRTRFARRRLANVRSLLPPMRGKHVIDLGCGMGTFTIEAARAGALALGIDPAPEAVAAARRVATEERVHGAHFVRGDAVRLPLGSGTADVVLAADLTEHLDDDTLQRMLAEAARVLRHGGQLVLYTPEHAHLFERLRERGILLAADPSHIGVRSADALAGTVAATGLSVQRVRFLPSHLPVWSLIERSLQRWVPLLRRRIGLVATKT